MFAMSVKLELFSLTNAYASVELVGPCKCVEVDTYAKLRPLLEGIHIVDWPFHSLILTVNVGLTASLRCSIEFFSVEYVPLQADSNLESKKCMCVVDLDFVLLPTNSRVHSRGG